MSKKKKNSVNEKKLDNDFGVSFSKSFKFFAYAVVVLAVLFAYSTSFSGVFVRDGMVEILENRNVHTLESPWKTMFEGNILPARPVPYLTFAINYVIHGEEVWGYHFVNLLIHLGSTFLLFGILTRTLLLPSMSGRFSAKESFALSFVITLLWAVHPVLTEAMNYIYQRMELLVSFFYLATLYTFIRARTSPNAFLMWTVLCIVCCSLGMLSKEVMVTAPIVLFWYNRVFLIANWKEFNSGSSLIYIPLAASWIIVFLLVQSQNDLWEGVFSDGQPTPWNYLMTQAEVIPYYLGLMLVPHPLCFEYGWPIQEDFSKVIVPGLFVVSLLFATLWAIIRRPKIGFLAGSFFLILAPTSTIKPIFQPAAEYRIYLVTSIFVSLVVFVIFHFSKKYSQSLSYKNKKQYGVISYVTILLIMVGFVLTTRERSKVYSSIATLWEDTAEKAPRNATAFSQLGAIQTVKGKLDKAEEYLDIANELQPNRFRTLNSLGQTEMHLGKLDEAILHLKQALAIKESHPEAVSYLGICYLNQGEFLLAAESLQKAHEIVPESPLYLSLYAAAIGKDSKRQKEAEEKFEKAIQLNPGFAKTYFSFAIFLYEAGRLEEALSQAQTCLQVDPNFSPARNLYQAILRKLKNKK